MITVPGGDDIMLGYQSLSFHDALYLRQVLGLRPAPEFLSWLREVGLADELGQINRIEAQHSTLRALAVTA